MGKSVEGLSVNFGDVWLKRFQGIFGHVLMEWDALGGCAPTPGRDSYALKCCEIFLQRGCEPEL